MAAGEKKFILGLEGDSTVAKSLDRELGDILGEDYLVSFVRLLTSARSAIDQAVNLTAFVINIDRVGQGEVGNLIKAARKRMTRVIIVSRQEKPVLEKTHGIDLTGIEVINNSSNGTTGKIAEAILKPTPPPGA